MSILLYYDLVTKKSYEIAKFEVNDSPQFVSIIDQTITIFIPYNLTEFKLIEINTVTGDQKVIELPEEFNSIYFSSFFRFYSNKKEIFALAYDFPYLKIYKNNFKAPADSIKLDAWLINTFYKAETGQLFCIEEKKNEKILQLEVIDLNKFCVQSKNFITSCDKITDAGLCELSSDSIALWYKQEDYITQFLTYDLKSKVASIPVTINAGIQSVINTENTSYAILSYHSDKFYEWTFGDIKDDIPLDTLKQKLTYTIQLDIISNLFTFDRFTKDRIINVPKTEQ